MTPPAPSHSINEQRTTINSLLSRLAELRDLRYSLAVLEWDMEVHMPTKGAEGRGRLIGTLSTLKHRLATDPEFVRLVETLEADASLAGDDALVVREAAYDLRRDRKLPESFVREWSEATTAGFNTWREARGRNDFAAYRPALERIVDLARRAADCYGYEESPYDALLENYERGATARGLRAIFDPLVRELRPILDGAIARQAAWKSEWTEGTWPVDAQRAVERRVLEAMGYDFEAGRVDVAPHPFCTMFALDDVRITTRYDEADVFSSLFTVMHEAGHALYDAGFDRAVEGTPLADAPSLGMHECNSRLWENIVGRSRPFAEWLLPMLRELHGARLAGVSADDVWRALNRVRPSLIRVEADEVTYNLHVAVRFELECDLIEGRLSVRDLPEAWNAKYKSHLGVDVPSDADGVMQDVHWSSGLFGYFPTYTLGNIYAAQVHAAFLRDVPDWDDRVRRGDLRALLDWLRPRIHRVGRRMTAPEIVRAVTGSAPDRAHLVRYLATKHGVA